MQIARGPNKWYFGGRTGAQESIVMRIREETVQKLRQEFLRIEMAGMVALIDHLWEMEKAGTPVTCVGSSTIDLHGLMGCKNMSEKELFETVFFRLNKLHFGSKNRSPFLDVAEAGPVLETAPLEARKRIDTIIGEFARIGTMVDKALRHRSFEETVDDLPVLKLN